MRDPRLHEKIAFLAFGLRAGESSNFVRVQLGDSHADHQATDLFLVKKENGKFRRLRIDLTEGHRRTISKKFQRNLDFKKKGGHWVWILRVQREPVISIAVDPCFSQAWDRLQTYEPRAFSPEDICPEHGRKCTLVEELSSLGRVLVTSLPKDWQVLFE